MGDSNFMPMKMLKEEVKNTLLSGAAVFFPDRQTRRHQLFTMMVNIEWEIVCLVPAFFMQKRGQIWVVILK